MLNSMCINNFPLRLYAAHINAPDEFYAVWYEKMPDARKQRADRFKIDADRHRCIMAYALLVHAVGELADDTHDDKLMSFPGGILPIEEGADGKPFIGSFPVSFNISHAGERVAVALAPQSVGCDVERKNRDALGIAKRFFTKVEYEYLCSLTDEEMRASEFTALWTLKESVVKCCGEGIRHPFGDFSLLDDTGNRKSQIRLNGSDNIYNIREYKSENGYHYSVCSLCEDMEDEMRFVSWEMISK